jgi:hypothetical protein
MYPAAKRNRLRRDMVRDACLVMLAAGVYPSALKLAERLPGLSPRTLARHRDKLAEAGELNDFRLAARGGASNPLALAKNREPGSRAGLSGETAAEYQEVQARIAAIRAEKIAAGERAVERAAPTWEPPICRNDRTRL